MKRKTVIILGVLTGLLLLAGCKKGSDEAKAEAVAEPVLPQKEQQAQDVRNEETGSEEANRDEEQAAVEAVVDGVAVDLGTGEATLSFLTGKWTLFDRETGMDYGTLTVGNDGVFEYERLSDGAKGKGTLSFELPEASKTDDPGMFELKFDDIGEFVDNAHYFEELRSCEGGRCVCGSLLRSRFCDCLRGHNCGGDKHDKRKEYRRNSSFHN